MSNQYTIHGSFPYTTKVVDFKSYSILYLTEYAETESKAKQKKAEAEERYQKDIKRVKGMTDMKYTFTEYINKWLYSDFLPVCTTSSSVLAEYTVTKLLLPNIQEDRLIGMVTPDYINAIIERGSNACATAQPLLSRFMRRIMLCAYAERLTNFNVASKVVPKKETKPGVIVPTKDDMKKLLAVAENRSEYLEILLASFGLRTGEIRGLKFNDVTYDEDTDTCVIRIERQVATSHRYNAEGKEDYPLFSKQAIETLPKSASSIRSIRVPGFIRKEIESRKELNKEIAYRRNTSCPLEYVCVSELTGRFKNDKTIRNALNKYCMEAGINSLTVHSLRHFSGSLLLECGIPLEHVSKYLGHKNKLTTMKYYLYILESDETARKFLDTLDPV